jgi:hypothetical protein
MLERARLVNRRKAGRDHYLSINSKPLDEAAAWIEAQRTAWNARLDALEALLKALAPPKRRSPGESFTRSSRD